MKVQRFYPKQVMKKLSGRDTSTLDKGEIAALTFFMRKGRKYGMEIGVLDEAKASDLLAGSKEALDAIATNTATRIHLKIA